MDENGVKFFNVVSETEEYYELVACQPMDCSENFITIEEYKSLCLTEDNGGDLTSYIESPIPYYNWTVSGNSYEPVKCFKLDYIAKEVDRHMSAWQNRRKNSKSVRVERDYDLYSIVGCGVRQELNQRGLDFQNSRVVKRRGCISKLDISVAKIIIRDMVTKYMEQKGILVRLFNAPNNDRQINNMVVFLKETGVTLETIINSSLCQSMSEKTQAYITEVWNNSTVQQNLDTI